MNQLDQSLIDAVAFVLRGKKLEKFLGSCVVLNQSLALGGWIKRGRAAAGKGFYQGLGRFEGVDDVFPHGHELNRPAFALRMCLNYGQPGVTLEQLWRLRQNERVAAILGKTHTSEAVTAWVGLCLQAGASFKALDAARPLPVITAIGLSPKVTATLKECALDLDISSIKLAKIDSKVILATNPKTGKVVEVTVYFVVWSNGIVHNRSRFARGGRCHACGKSIPSGRFVPVEAYDNASEDLVSMWLGCDCAKNIFGIQDVGVQQEASNS